MNESPAGPNEAVWSVARGAAPGVNAVEPASAGVVVPEAVRARGRRHGLDGGGSTLRLLVTGADEAGTVAGEIAGMWHPLPGEQIAGLAGR
ncbi:hypothetical protein [Dactylosporangium sp. CA-233914]|uniref:hypothetical protein n=1 Tax=Dactylosporangium sp. CA-233914 TaxID=3239934 RepID=UPI003D92209E